MVGVTPAGAYTPCEQALVSRPAKHALGQSRVEAPPERERAGERHTSTVARPASGDVVVIHSLRAFVAEMPKPDPGS